MKKTILVTGGAGYVGSILLRRLLDRGYQVICLDCLRYGGASLVELRDNPNFVLENVDINKFNDVETIVKHYQLDGIVHLAAIVGDPACKLEPELARRTNLEASLNLIEQARKYRVPRFVFASTCSNYGKMEDSNGYVDETSPLNLFSLYAQLKVAVEKILLTPPQNMDGFCPTVLRFSTVYGVSPRMRFDLTVNEFTKELALGRELVVYGENYWRPYCHVSDFSQAILGVLDAPREKVTYNVYNVGDSSQNYTKKMIIDELLRHIPSAIARFVKSGADRRDYRVSFDKIKNEIGFSITKTVPDGMGEILACLRQGLISNPDDPIYYNTPAYR